MDSVRYDASDRAIRLAIVRASVGGCDRGRQTNRRDNLRIVRRGQFEGCVLMLHQIIGQCARRADQRTEYAHDDAVMPRRGNRPQSAMESWEQHARKNRQRQQKHQWRHGNRPRSGTTRGIFEQEMRGKACGPARQRYRKQPIVKTPPLTLRQRSRAPAHRAHTWSLNFDRVFAPMPLTSNS